MAASEQEIPTRKPAHIGDADWVRMRTDYKLAFDAYKAAASEIAESLARGNTPTKHEINRELSASEVLSAARRLFWAAWFGLSN